MNTSLLEQMLILVLSIWITRQFLDIFLVERKMCLWKKILFWGIYLALNLGVGNWISTAILNTVFGFLCTILISEVFYKGSIYKKVICSTFFILLWTSCEILTGYIFMRMGLQLEEIRQTGSAVSKIVFLTIIWALQYTRADRKIGDVSLYHWAHLCLIPLGSLWMIHSLYTLYQSAFSGEGSLVFSVSLMMLILLNLDVFQLYDRLCREKMMEMKNSLYEQQIRNITIQNQEMEEVLIESGRLRHNMKNHVICMKEYVMSGQYSQLIEYMEQVSDFEGESGSRIADSGNLVIDALINKKYEVMQKTGISLELQLCIPRQMPFEAAVLCVIIGNGLDNAIEAVESLKDNRQIQMKMIYGKGTLSVKIENCYNGKTRKKLSGRYLTTKKDGKNHGIGLTSIRQAVERYDGILEIKEAEKRFVLEALLYENSNVS